MATIAMETETIATQLMGQQRRHVVEHDSSGQSV